MANETILMRIVPKISKKSIDDVEGSEILIGRISDLIKNYGTNNIALAISLNGSHGSGKTEIIKNLPLQYIARISYYSFNLLYLTENINNENPGDYYITLIDKVKEKMINSYNICVLDHLELLYEYWRKETKDIEGEIKHMLIEMSMISRDYKFMFIITIPTSFITLDFKEIGTFIKNIQI